SPASGRRRPAATLRSPEFYCITQVLLCAAEGPPRCTLAPGGARVSLSQTFQGRSFRRDAESPSRTGVTRETRALPGQLSATPIRSQNSRGFRGNAIDILSECDTDDLRFSRIELAEVFSGSD